MTLPYLLPYTRVPVSAAQKIVTQVLAAHKGPYPMAPQAIFSAALDVKTRPGGGKHPAHIPTAYKPAAPTFPLPPHPEHPVRSLSFLRRVVLPRLKKEERIAYRRVPREGHDLPACGWVLLPPPTPTPAQLLAPEHAAVDAAIKAERAERGLGESLDHLRPSLRAKRAAEHAHAERLLALRANREKGEAKHEWKGRARMLGALQESVRRGLADLDAAVAANGALAKSLDVERRLRRTRMAMGALGGDPRHITLPEQRRLERGLRLHQKKIKRSMEVVALQAKALRRTKWQRENGVAENQQQPPATGA